MVSAVSSSGSTTLTQKTSQPTVDTVESRLAALKKQLDNLSDPSKAIDNGIELLQEVQSRIANTQALLEKLKNGS
jgi:cell division protein FtsB